jgi:hypothetical protein
VLRLHASYFAAPGVFDGGGGGLLSGLRLSDSPAATAWALGLVRSRTFGRVRPRGGPTDAAAAAGGPGAAGPVSLLMVPGVDLVNHSFDHNAELCSELDTSTSTGAPAAVDGPGSTGHISPLGGASGGGGGGGGCSGGGGCGGGGLGGLRLVVRALRAVAAGEELTISYGADKSNAVLFANYGAGARGKWGGAAVGAWVNTCAPPPPPAAV